MKPLRRGDIYNVDLNPTQGHEQQGQRPVLVISPDAFNRANPPLCAPITGGGTAARLGLLTIPLMGAGNRTTGVVLCSQLRTMDLAARHAKFIEHLDDSIVRAVLLRVTDIYEL